jgi:hypothetical protein
MEANANAFRIELREHDRRISGLHRSLGVLSTDVGNHKTDISVLHTELGNIREDIAELKTDMKWIKRGLFGAIAVGLMFVVAVATLIVQVAGG